MQLTLPFSQLLSHSPVVKETSSNKFSNAMKSGAQSDLFAVNAINEHYILDIFMMRGQRGLNNLRESVQVKNRLFLCSRFLSVCCEGAGDVFQKDNCMSRQDGFDCDGDTPARVIMFQ
jgi:hypothetical protein